MAKKREEKIRKELLDELLKDYSTPEDLLGKNGMSIYTQIPAVIFHPLSRRCTRQLVTMQI